MTDTSSGDIRDKGSYVVSPGGLGSVPPALLSGYIVILNAPIVDIVVKELIPPDWFPATAAFPVYLMEWHTALHG